MKRHEKRDVRIEQNLEVIVWTCDNCEKEISTSRDLYFGDGRLVVEGVDLPWYQVGIRAGTNDFSEQPVDLCSTRCLIEWSTRQPSLEWQQEHNPRLQKASR